LNLIIKIVTLTIFVKNGIFVKQMHREGVLNHYICYLFVNDGKNNETVFGNKIINLAEIQQK